MSHMLPENRFPAETEQDTILMDDFISLFESEMKNLDYFNESINRRIRMLKIPYLADKSILLEKQCYSTEISAEWLESQRRRMLKDEISHSHFLFMQSVIESCEELYRTGKIERRARRRTYEKYIPSEYQTIHKDFQQSFDVNLSPRTIKIHETICRSFFNYLAERNLLKINSLTRHIVEDFLKQIHSSHTGSMSKVTLTVKLLLSYLREHSYIDFSLDTQMLKPAAVRKPVLPCFSHEEVDEILSVINTSTRNGKRDYAIILLAARTGLRSSDIFNLKLYDIDWKNNEIDIKQAKTGTSFTLPLQPDVGNAIADYILHGRPDVYEDYIFLRNDPPYVRLEGHCSGNTILMRYLAKVSFKWESCTGKTFHAFRRSIGSWMSKEGVPLPTIAEVLGHKNMNSTKSYLSYDKNSMEKCCLGLDGILVLKEGLR